MTWDPRSGKRTRATPAVRLAKLPAYTSLARDVEGRIASIQHQEPPTSGVALSAQ